MIKLKNFIAFVMAFVLVLGAIPLQASEALSFPATNNASIFPETGEIFELKTYLATKNIGDDLITGSDYITPSHDNVISIIVRENILGRYLDVTRENGAATEGAVINIPGGFLRGDRVSAVGRASAGGSARFQFNAPPNGVQGVANISGGAFNIFHTITAASNGDGTLNTGLRVIGTNVDSETNFQIDFLTVIRKPICVDLCDCNVVQVGAFANNGGINGAPWRDRKSVV